MLAGAITRGDVGGGGWRDGSLKDLGAGVGWIGDGAPGPLPSIETVTITQQQLRFLIPPTAYESRSGYSATSRFLDARQVGTLGTGVISIPMREPLRWGNKTDSKITLR
jgi:hypothetical protein